MGICVSFEHPDIRRFSLNNMHFDSMVTVSIRECDAHAATQCLHLVVCAAHFLNTLYARLMYIWKSLIK